MNSSTSIPNSAYITLRTINDVCARSGVLGAHPADKSNRLDVIGKIMGSNQSRSKTLLCQKKETN